MYHPQEQGKHGQSDTYSMKYETRERSLKMEKLFANITYYKLWAKKHFGYYIISLRDKGHGVSSTEEILNQAFIIPKVCHG